MDFPEVTELEDLKLGPNPSWFKSRDTGPASLPSLDINHPLAMRGPLDRCPGKEPAITSATHERDSRDVGLGRCQEQPLLHILQPCSRDRQEHVTSSAGAECIFVA